LPTFWKHWLRQARPRDRNGIFHLTRINLFQLIRTIILVPSDFGLMGLALLAMSALETFIQTGFQAALIQKKGDIRDYLDTAWTVSALRGLALFAVLFFAAPYIALFFDTPAATPIMRVIGVSMLLNRKASMI